MGSPGRRACASSWAAARTLRSTWSPARPTPRSVLAGRRARADDSGARRGQSPVRGAASRGGLTPLRAKPCLAPLCRARAAGARRRVLRAMHASIAWHFRARVIALAKPSRLYTRRVPRSSSTNSSSAKVRAESRQDCGLTLMRSSVRGAGPRQGVNRAAWAGPAQTGVSPQLGSHNGNSATVDHILDPCDGGGPL